MELFVFFMIAAIGGFWWLNHVTNKRAREQAEAQVTAEKSAPYKVETKVEPAVEAAPQPAPVTEPPVTAEAIAEVAPVKVKNPRKPVAKKPPVGKAVIKKNKPKATKAKK